MGGTFDPIHIGHLILGENAWHQFGLEKVLLCLLPIRLTSQNRIGRADIQERVDMVRGAIADNPHLNFLWKKPSGKITVIQAKLCRK